ncbi:chaplin family protein [Actinomadura litoris]|uniref:DUF320 domain-containing protein n=1 Tax=Actinomadura litoris TaxID=2678616 RepID=A0A7K1L275_9ACTN|nr:chaplin family protein [Actinomadura litoris]MUN38403.1 DUF320 domain-containing protein [Actinomadura litoris]
MRIWSKNTGRAALVAAASVALGAGGLTPAASADPGGMHTSGMFSVLGGNQVYAPISVPVEVSGNAIAVLGVAQAGSKGGAHVSNARHGGGGGGGMQTSGMFSILGGNQIYAPISVPVDVCGNAVAVLGVAKAWCKGGASVTNDGHGHHHKAGRRAGRTGAGNRGAQAAGRSGAAGTAREWSGGWEHGGGHGHGMQTSGMFSILGGNQIYAPISAPINVCGNAVAVLGVAKAWCKGGAHVTNKRSGGPDMKTSGMFSIGGGNQVYLPVSVPINICGNAIAVLGVAQAYCEGGATVNNGGKEEHPPKVWPKKPHKPHKPRKPRKHRPATVHHKLPSTDRLLTDGSAKDRPGTDRPSADRRATRRLAAPRPGPRPGAPRPAAEPGLPVVRDLTGGTPLPGDGPVRTSLQKKAPVTVGAPLLS